MTPVNAGKVVGAPFALAIHGPDADSSACCSSYSSGSPLAGVSQFTESVPTSRFLGTPGAGRIVVVVVGAAVVAVGAAVVVVIDPAAAVVLAAPAPAVVLADGAAEVCGGEFSACAGSRTVCTAGLLHTAPVSGRVRSSLRRAGLALDWLILDCSD